MTPWTAAHQVSLSSALSQSLLRFMSIESVMLSNHLILCHPLLLSLIFSRIRVFSSESLQLLMTVTSLFTDLAGNISFLTSYLYFSKYLGDNYVCSFLSVVFGCDKGFIRAECLEFFVCFELNTIFNLAPLLQEKGVWENSHVPGLGWVPGMAAKWGFWKRILEWAIVK